VALVTSSRDSLGVVTITLSDEANLNAMSEEMAADFSAVVSKLKQSGDTSIIILTGAGKSFSAGGHLEMLDAKRQKTPEQNRLGMLAFYDSFLSILSLNVPIIAALQGAAVGAGLCLACACDVRIATSDAKLGFTFLKLGLHPGMGGTFLLPRVVGRTMATELLLTGRIISADEALRIGLVSRIVPREKLLEEANSIAREMLSCGPVSSAQLLQTMRVDLVDLQAALEHEARCQSTNYASAEFAEGISAIREKRAARFRGA
jgi:enoyl-CoA hydratase/carnithine racemase